MPDLGKATYTLELNTTPYDTGLVQAEAKADAATTSIGNKFTAMGKKASASMTHIGSKLTKVLTVPVLAVGIAAGTMAYRFEGSMNKISALVGVGEKQMHEYHDAVLDMVDVVGKGPKELADALYFITSAGFKGASALKVLKASAKASAAGLGETEVVADAVTSAVNAYGESVLSAARATDIMLAAVREGKAEPAEFASSIGRVIAPANLLGVSFDEVSSAVAAMSLQGLDAAEATTALRGVLLTFARPTTEAVKALKSLGEESGLSTAEQVRASIANEGLLKTMVKLKAAFGDNVEGMAAVFGNVRAFVGGQILTGATLSKNERIFAKITGTVGDTDEAFEKVSKTAEFKLDKAMANIEKSLTILGGTIMPMAADAMSVIAEKVGKLGDKFNSLSPQAKKLIIIIAGIAAAAGPVLLFMGALVSAFIALAPVVVFLISPLGILVAALVALGVAMVWAKTSPETLAKMLEKLGMSSKQAATAVKILGVAFDVVAEIIVYNVRQIGRIVKLGFQLIGDAIDILIGLLTLDFGRAWSGMKGLIMDPLNAVKDLVVNWVKALKEILTHIWDGMREKGLRAVLQIVEPFSHLPGLLGKKARATKENIERELEKIDAKKAADKIPKAFENIVPKFGIIGTKSGEAYSTGMWGVVNPMFNLLITKAEETGKTIFDEIGGALQGVADQWGAIAAGAAGVKPEEAFFDGKKWRDAQGKVIKDQKRAWVIWNNWAQDLVEQGLYKKPPKPQVNAKIKMPPLIDLSNTGGGKTGGGKKPPGLGGDETGSGIIPYDTQIALEQAKQTPSDADDLKILKQEEAFLTKLLKNRNLSRAKRLEILQELTGVTTEIQGINDKVKDALDEKKLVLIPPKLERQQATAAQTKWLGDDLARAKEEKQWLKKLLKQKGFTAEQKQEIRMALIAADGKIDQINKDILAKLKETPVLWTAKMRIRATKAERTESLKDDLAVQKDELAYLKKLLKNKKLDLEQRADIMEEITRVLARIKEINKEVADATKDANKEMKELSFNIMGERAGFFATFGSNAFSQAPGGSGETQRMPGSTDSAGPQAGRFMKGGVVKPKYYAVGGRAGATGTTRDDPAGGFKPKGTDTVPAMLTPGELVLNSGQIAKLAKALGTGNSATSVFNAIKKLGGGPTLPTTGGAATKDAGAATKTATTIQADVVRITTPKVIFEDGDRNKTSKVQDIANRPRDIGVKDTKAATKGVVIEHFENVQNFEAPTPDRNREARMAKIAVESVFDTGAYHG